MSKLSGVSRWGGWGAGGGGAGAGGAGAGNKRPAPGPAGGWPHFFWPIRTKAGPLWSGLQWSFCTKISN